MSAKMIAKKYAKALISVGQESPEGSERFRPGLARVRELFAVPQAYKILKSPVMPDGLKYELLMYAVNGDTQAKHLIVFLELLLAVKRVQLLPAIVEEFEEMLAEAKGQLYGVLTTVLPTGSQEQNALATDLSKLFGKRVVLENRVDAKLLGGFTIRIGNTVIDQSITSKLTALTRQLQLS